MRLAATFAAWRGRLAALYTVRNWDGFVISRSQFPPPTLSNLLTRLFCKLTTRIFPMNDLTPTERQAAIIADLQARLELANERIFFLSSQHAKLLSALKLMVFRFDAHIDSEYCGTDLLTEQLAQADFAREVIREVEGK